MDDAIRVTEAQLEVLVAIRDSREGWLCVGSEFPRRSDGKYVTIRRPTARALERAELVETRVIREMWGESVPNGFLPGWHTKWHPATVRIDITELGRFACGHIPELRKR